jgi:hypothetical protein
MRRLGLVFVTVAVLAVLSPNQQAHAGGNGVAVGLLGGLAAGTIIGSAMAGPRYYYYEPMPVEVEMAVPGPMPVGCYWTRGAPVWDGYRGIWVRPRVQVCD